MDGHEIDNVYIGLEAGGDAEQKVTALDKALEKLITTLESIDNKLTGFQGNLKGIESAIGNINIPTSKLDQAAEDVEKATGEIKESIEEVKSISPGDSASKDFDRIGNSAKRISGFTANLQRILQSTKGIFSDVGAFGLNAFKKITKSIKNAHNSSKNYNKGLRGLLETAKRFLVFGTFFTIQRQISQAFQEGTQNLYQYSKAIDGKFAQSMDRLATSFLYLKNAIGAAVAPIINYFTPMLERMIDSVAEFGNKLAEAIAALTGQSTFKKAIKSHKEYAEAVNKTNNALAKFDEINNITTSKGKDELDYGSMFEVVDVKIDTKSWFGNIVQNIKNGDWKSVGSAFAQGFNKALKKLYDFDLGKKLGQIINGAVDFLIGFVTTFSWTDFANTITMAITRLFNTVKWGNVGDLFSKLMVGAMDFISAVVKWLGDTSENGPIEQLTTALCDFIDGINTDELVDSFSRLITKVIEAAFKLIWKLPKLGDKLANSVVEFFGKLMSSAFTKALDLPEWTGQVGKFATAAWAINTGNPFLSSGGYKSIGNTIKKIFGFANGGYPASGEMFIARENGIPEMVGSIGGRTAVANNDQIVDAVSIGVYNAVVDAMSRTNNGGDTIVQIDGREVFRAVRTQNNDFVRRTGASAF